MLGNEIFHFKPESFNCDHLIVITESLSNYLLVLVTKNLMFLLEIFILITRNFSIMVKVLFRLFAIYESQEELFVDKMG